MVSLSSDPELEQVRKYVKNVLTCWKSRSNEIILISEDPTFDEVKNQGWHNGKSFGFDVTLSDFQHLSLLYQLRNSLVHQFQARANELGSNNPDTPFYQVVKEIGMDKQLKPIHIEMVYPSDFLKSMSENVLSNVVQYLKDGNINPFPYYHAGDYWISTLNR